MIWTGDRWTTTQLYHRIRRFISKWISPLDSPIIDAYCGSLATANEALCQLTMDVRGSFAHRKKVIRAHGSKVIRAHRSKVIRAHRKRVIRAHRKRVICAHRRLGFGFRGTGDMGAWGHGDWNMAL